MHVRAINNNIIVEEARKVRETMVITSNLDTYRKGVVTSVGEDIKNIRVGMTVSYDKDSVYRISVEDNDEVKTVVVLKEPDVYAIIV